MRTNMTLRTSARRGVACAIFIPILMVTLFAALAPSASAAEALPIVEAIVTSPPNVPPPITRDQPARVIVKVEVREIVGEITAGVQYTYWTFGGSVPGVFIRARVGDEVEFHLANHPDNRMPHNIDLHAVTGPGGGAASSFTPPGHTTQFSFKVLNPGLYVYHCATAPVGMHIANGMYGLILIEPEGGLPPVDREYYVMQGDFYTHGAYGEAGLQAFDMAKALTETPDYVVFNGTVGSLVGDNAITAAVGEKIRLYVGNGGPNMLSSFHVIGEIFDHVYAEGGFPPSANVQTTLIPSGGATIVDFKVEVPGTYILVDHSIFRAFNKGALGMLKVDGAEDKVIYSGLQDDRIYQAEGGAVQVMPGAKAPVVEKELTKNERFTEGERIYNQICFACHQANGQGIPGAFPPLAKSDFLMADWRRAVEGIVFGRSGKIVVNGKSFDGVMPALQMSDDEIASVVTYVTNAWGNEHEMITPTMVREAKVK